ncbi:hypothetical protein RDABS01_013637 [Bienertia sinuspersici]
MGYDVNDDDDEDEQEEEGSNEEDDNGEQEEEEEEEEDSPKKQFDSIGSRQGLECFKRSQTNKTIIQMETSD